MIDEVYKSRIDWDKIGFVFAYLLPTLLLLFVFFSNRSLFLDGLNLARNVAESSFSELSKPLKYQQSAPLLFLYISKISTLFFNISEYSLRLLPLFSGLACLYFFGNTLNRIISSKYALIGIIWLGTHSMFIRYATEFKQYSTDAFVSIFLIWFALKINKLTTRSNIAIGAIGAVSIWLSMPSIFVLFGLIVYYLHIQYKSGKTLLPIVILAVWFVLNFVIEYYLILSPAIDSDHMQNFHQNYFIQGKLWRLDSLKHDFGLIISIIRMAVGKSGIAIAIAMVLIIVCINDFVKKKKSTGLLLALPIVAVLGASLLEKYSLIERLMIFTLPILFLLILLGFQIVVEIIRDKNIWLKYFSLAIIGIAFIVGFIQTQGLKYFCQTLEIEDNRSALIYIDQYKKRKNSIICTQLAFPAYAYYTKHDKRYENLNLGKAIVANYAESVVELAINQCIEYKEDVWILMGHMQENEISKLIAELDKTGTIKNSYRTKRSAAILFSTQ